MITVIDLEKSKMVVCISYSDEQYEKAKRWNLETARRVGKANQTIAYGPQDIDEKFRTEHADILQQPRGNGYWLWKPYVIYKTLLQLQEGDVLVYADAGSYYVAPVRFLIKAMRGAGSDMMPFELEFRESAYTKRDAFLLMGCDSPEYADTPQRMAGFQVIRKTEKTVQFVKEWLEYAGDSRINTDSPSVLGENYPDFIENRHDQTVFSLLSKKYGMVAFRDPSQFGNGRTYANSPYPQIWQLHRDGRLDGQVLKAIERDKKISAAKEKLNEMGILEPILRVKRIFIPKK